jgi:hypothetical protein
VDLRCAGRVSYFEVNSGTLRRVDVGSATEVMDVILSLC